MLQHLSTQLRGLRASRLRRTSRYKADMAAIPAELFPYWQASAHDEFPGIPRDAFFFARAVEGLLTFFDCARRSERPCGLPSLAVDSVWHAWMRMDADGLDTYCLKRFGRTMPHLTATEMATDMDMALAASLVQARTLDDLPTAGTRVPRLFRLDGDLCMPNGYEYGAVNGEVGYWRLDATGSRAGAIIFPAAMNSHRMFSEGLVTGQAYAQARRQEVRRLRREGGAGAGGAVVGGDAACADGGGCGAGCGGGS